jgi:hypothetical protein
MVVERAGENEVCCEVGAWKYFPLRRLLYEI